MQHAYTTPDYPGHWDDEDEPTEYIMVFQYEGTCYRVYGEWNGSYWSGAMYSLNDDGEEVKEVSDVALWNAAEYAFIKGKHEDLEEVK